VENKSRRKLITLLILLFVFIAGAGVLYWSLSSPKGFNLTWGRFARLIPGSLTWERLDLDPLHRTLDIRNLIYTHSSGVRIVTVEHLFLKFRWSSLFRTRAMLEDLRAENITVDLGSLPPGKRPGSLSNVIRELTRRLAVDRSRFSNVRIVLKNGYLLFPATDFTFQPGFLEKNEVHLVHHGIEGEIAGKNIYAELLQYDGSFSEMGKIKNVFVFRKAAGTLLLKGAQFGTLRLADLKTEASFDGTTIDFQGVHLEVGPNAFLLKGKFSPFDKTYEGKLSSVGTVELQTLPSLPPRLARAYERATLSLDFDLAGFVFKEMEGKFSMNLKAQGNRINPKVPTLTINIAAKAKEGRFELTQFDYLTERTKMGGKGFVDAAQRKLGVSLSGTGLDLFTFVHFFSDQDIHGFVDFSGTIQGELKNPDFRFQGKALESGYKFMRYGENGGTFEILNGNMRYSGRSPAGASYSDSVEVNTASLFDGKKRRTQLKAAFNNLDVSSLLETPGMTGKIDGNWEMEVNQAQKSGKLAATIKDFHLYQFHIGDMEIQGKLVNNTFSFPLLTFHPPKIEKLTTPRETVFQFDDAGFNVKGSPIAGMDVEGKYLYSRQNILDMKATCKACSTAPLLTTLEFPPLEGSIDGKVTMEMVIGNFDASKMNAEVDRLDVPIGEGRLTQSSPLRISFSQGLYHLDQVALAFNGETAKLSGSYSTSRPINVQLTGRLDLGILSEFKEYFREAEGPAGVDLKITGPHDKPDVRGSIKFDGASVSLRAFPNPIEDLKGTLLIDDQKISTEGLQGSISEGDLSIRGTVWHDHFKIRKADLKADAREIAYSEPGTYKMFLSGKLSLTGEEPRMVLSGDLDVTEGRYFRNFEIREFIIKPAAAPVVAEKGMGFENLNLDLKIRSTGELLIKNNAAELYLKSDLKIGGTKAKPTYAGTLEILDGQIHFFKLNFENAKGYIDLSNRSQDSPYVDITTQHLFERPTEEIQVTARVEGYSNNLQLSFNSNPPLEKRDILALVFTGALPEEHQQISGTSIASSVLASQLTSVLQGPVTGLTGLDIFRLEASDPESKSLSSLVVGKQLTERLSLEFKTDLSVEESVKSIQAEYLLFDNILLKGARSTEGKYRLELTFRLRGY
jgi:autotransporter translocation and assembly factor TamB